jgi:hypothetical protein
MKIILKDSIDDIKLLIENKGKSKYLDNQDTLLVFDIDEDEIAETSKIYGNANIQMQTDEKTPYVYRFESDIPYWYVVPSRFLMEFREKLEIINLYIIPITNYACMCVGYPKEVKKLAEKYKLLDNLIRDYYSNREISLFVRYIDTDGKLQIVKE